MSENDSTFVNTLLSPGMLADLERVKAYHGFNNRSETIRYLIRKEKRNIDTRTTVQMTVPSDNDQEAA